MKYTIRIILLTGVVAFLFSQADIIDLEAQTITAEDIYESFIYEDYIVEGVIQSINLEWILHEEYNPYITHPALLGEKTQVVKIEFAVDSLLIGTLNKREIILLGKNREAGGKSSYLLDLKEGDRLIIPIRYLNKGDYKTGNKYLLVGWNSSRFLIKENLFERGLKSDPIQTGKVKDLYKAIEEIKRRRSIRTITNKSDLIVRGKVINKWITEDTFSSGKTKNIERIRIAVDTCFKGNIENDSIEFSSIKMAIYNPPWKTPVPAIKRGEDWLVFLKWAEEPGYYPFAGLNGMFKIKSDKLIRDNRIVMERDLQEVKSIIFQEISGGDEDAK